MEKRGCFYLCPAGPLGLYVSPWISPLILSQQEFLEVVNNWTQEVINKTGEHLMFIVHGSTVLCHAHK